MHGNFLLLLNVLNPRGPQIRVLAAGCRRRFDGQPAVHFPRRGADSVVCRRMNPQGINPSLPTVFGTMNKMNDGVGEREEKKWSLKPRR